MEIASRRLELGDFPREGMAVVRTKGKLRGKKPKLPERQQKELRRMYDTGEYSISDLAELFLFHGQPSIEPLTDNRNTLYPPLFLRNEMQNRYGKLASWVYNLDKPIGRSFGDQEYYRQRLEYCDGGPILEPAVGNGRLLVPLLEAGFPIEGFDASIEMLGYCQDECRKRNLSASLTRQTFEKFSYDKRFAAIIIPAGSLQLVTDVASAAAVLKRFYNYLAPNGRLIVDLDPIGSFLGPSGSVRTWMTEGGDLLTLTDHRIETNYIAQTTLSHLRYEHWQGGNLMTTELDLFKLRWWGVNEFSLALRAAGFTDVVVSGNYRHGQVPQKDDEIISFEARRPANELAVK